MSSFYQSVIRIISKPSNQRKDEEIQMILSWFINLFKKKAAVFGDINSEIVADIIKNCSFETKKADEIIIKQGDVGDCFYINLHGQVSIYINHKKHDEQDNIDDNTSLNENQSEIEMDDLLNSSITSAFLSNKNRSKKLREKLGNYVTSLGAGEGFGEIALVSDDYRTATIITDETTDLMVVNKSLYARCLQAPTLRKLAEKRDFINNSPFFGNWAPKMKKLLSLCLERDIIPYDSYLGKQGEPADKIYFIISGQAKITVNPSIHLIQYPKLYPLKLPENEENDLITSLINEKKIYLNNKKRRLKSNQQSTNKSNNIFIKRRNQTFAEAEQHLKTKNIEIGILGPGEITGMCEIIYDMPTYMQSTRCLEDCDVFYIFKRSYERLIAKRNSFCINKMKENVHMKLIARNNRLKFTTPIDLYRSIQFKIELSNRKRSIDTSNIPIISSNIKNKNQPRGSIVKLESRPKSSPNSVFKKQLNDSITLKLDNAVNNDFNDLNQENDLTNNSINENNQEGEIEHLNDMALENLETRMKNWHIDLGCRKAYVPKLNRIDIEKIRKDVKAGGNIFIKRTRVDSKSTNSRLRLNVNRSRSNSDAYSNSSSENTSTENENDLLTNFKYNSRNANFLKPAGENMLSNEAKFFDALSHKLLPFENQPTIDLNHNILNYIDQEEFPQTQLIQIDQSNKIIDEISLVPHSSSNGCVLFVPSYFNFTPPKPIIQNQQCRKSSVNSVSLDIANINETSNNDISLLSENQNHKKENSSFSEINIENSFNSTNTRNSTCVSSGENNVRKYSIPNMIFNRRESSHLTPYVVKRKYSIGQIKIQHSGKKYSKEEYYALKDELRKQTRRCSISSAYS